ncbi:hypothetical protein LEM8419_02838 [Neolewinella maritima]|uniref:DUF1772 domain-containing protein n=1 Tax=Neolewinella maritima TaxID=1383882 RepID=A0ABM9B3L3_9BACT|nr:hypothetical protein [Neolewinella maritima]CAH1001924.1 hypothetical protein LEM8419_02838 [Neolewinella maritima]
MIAAWEWLATLGTSWALFGLIWTIQLVHYPSFHFVPEFSDFHPHHTRSITLIVAPLMVAELAVSAWMAYRTDFQLFWVIALLVVLVIWGITFFQAIPLHELLATQREDSTIDALVRVNWPRTLLWTLKAVSVSLLYLFAAGTD